MLKLIQKKLADKTVSVSKKKHIHRVFSLQSDLGMEISPECQLSFSNKPRHLSQHCRISCPRVRAGECDKEAKILNKKPTY